MFTETYDSSDRDLNQQRRSTCHPWLLPERMTVGQSFKHQELYDFWSRSEGLWHSKLVKVAIKILTPPDLLAITQLHLLEQPEFGIRMSWEYNTSSGSGQMLWCVDAKCPNLVFTDKGISPNTQPSMYHYQLLSSDILITIDGKAEETNVLEQNNNRRLRELRYDGKLIRRHWENKFGA
jgi:hypothetical protein